ncbi:MAG: SusC/RagA family TonB-linked outer membrane protein [Candidatus Cryptobacteroides sp.]
MKLNDHLLRLAFLITLAFIPATGLLAQSFPPEISGTIKDAATGEPLIGAYLTIDGISTSGAVSDIDGNYTLSIPSSIAKNANITVAYIGYRELNMRLSDLISAPVVFMEVDSELLEEVLVVGYGVQKKASNVGSISQAKGEDLLQSGNVNTVSEALQGRLNGVTAINSTGQPGDNAASILIRGKSTWQEASPLVLVDGIERNMNDVDFNEIESISVLKDASATAVYGVRGGNGVILLTTKRGTSEKPTVSFNANVAFKNPTANLDWPDYVTSMKLYNEAAANDNAWSNVIPQSTIDAWSNAYATGNYGPYNDYFPEIDYSYLLKTAISQNYNVNIDGKSDFMKYFASIGYQQDGSIYDVQKNSDYDPRSWYKKLNWRANFDFKLTKTTTLSLNVAGKMGIRNSEYYTNIYRAVFTSPINLFPIKYSDGMWGDSSVTRGENVIANLNHSGQTTNNTFQGWYDARLNQDFSFITEGLSAHAVVSYSTSTASADTFRDGGLYTDNPNESKDGFPVEWRKYDYSNPIYDENGNVTYPLLESGTHGLMYEMPNNASYNNLKSVSTRLYYEVGVNWARNFNGHDISAMALFNRQKIDESASGASKFQFSQYTEDWVGRITYNWKERYLAEFNISYTGSEKFAPGKRFGLFPSFSVGWRLTEEPWMKWSSRFLSNFKIRYSWGKVGNDRGANRFQYVQLYDQNNGQNFGKDMNVLWGPGYTEGKLASPDATWETSIKQDLGFEIGLWKKLRIELDLYDEQRSGILLAPRTSAPWIGASLTASNIGKTKSHGIDLSATWNDKIGTDFHYSVNFMFSTSENRIVFRDDPADFLDYEKDAGKPIGYQSRYIVSGNYGSIDDIFNAAQTSLTTADKLVPGDFAYIDFNADGVINDKDVVPMANVNYPLTTFTLGLSFDWKGLGLSAMFYAPTGVYSDYSDYYMYDFPGKLEAPKAQPQSIDRWTPATANDSGVKRPAIHQSQSTHNYPKNNANTKGGNTWMYADHSYIRLKNLEISYRLPKKVAKTMRMTRCQIFASGNNLFTWWSGDYRIDPETNGENVYPIVKSYTVGLRFAF